MGVEIRIFDPPTADAPVFRNVGLAQDAASVETVERLYTPGCFTVDIPTGARHAEMLTIGRLVWIGRGFWGIIDDLKLHAAAEGDVLTVSGRQLKGLTLDRITIPPAFNALAGAQGYDTATGPTETVMKHFVAGNLCNAAQPSRVVWGLEVAPDLGRGIAADKYMTRHDVLADVLAALGEAAELGYDITPDLTQHTFIFDVVAGLDHTGLQRHRKPVVFDLNRGTALMQEYTRNTSDSRNLFYATMSGAEFADEALTAAYIRDGEPEPVGIHRREKHLDVSADTPVAGEEYNELRRKALIEAEGFKPAEGFQCEIAVGPLVYGTDYALGDLVSVVNRPWGVTMHTRLTELKTAYSAGSVTRTATFGTAPLEVFGRLKRQITKGR